MPQKHYTPRYDCRYMQHDSWVCPAFRCLHAVWKRGRGSGIHYSMSDIEGREKVEMVCADCRWCPMHAVAQLTVQKTAVAI